MGYKVKASEIAKLLHTTLYGSDIELVGVSALSKPENWSLIFSKSNTPVLPETGHFLLLVPLNFDIQESHISTSSFIKVSNPRLAFAKVVSEFFTQKIVPGICASSKIGCNCKIDKSVRIGSYCVIGNNVEIGPNTVINNSVVIGDDTIIGKDCYIKSGAVLGEDGFGFEFDEAKVPIRIPHIGNVILGNNVEVGANSVIARGTIGSTTIENNVKIDDSVFIAHNCKIGESTLVIAFAEISGSVTIGKNCWIAPNCTIINKVRIGDNVVVGIGALIINDIPSNTKYMGLEALELRTLKKMKKQINYGVKF